MAANCIVSVIPRAAVPGCTVMETSVASLPPEPPPPQDTSKNARRVTNERARIVALSLFIFPPNAEPLQVNEKTLFIIIINRLNYVNILLDVPP
jgi:hypothetical protein